MGLGTIALILGGGLFLYFLLKGYSTIRIEAPKDGSMQPQPTGTNPGAARECNALEVEPKEGASSQGEWPEDWEATYMGEDYTARSYDGVVMTVSIEIKDTLPIHQEINARIERPELSQSAIAGDINALLYLGANYVDIGYNTNWIAAEFPISTVKVDERLAKRAVTHLIRLRDAAENVQRNA